MAERRGAKRSFLEATSSGASSSARPAAPDPAPILVAAEDPAQRFREYISRMCLMNKLSGLETQQTSQLATKAQTKGVADLGKAWKSGSHPGNISRGLVRTILMNVKEPAPEPYFAEILTQPRDEAGSISGADSILVGSRNDGHDVQARQQPRENIVDLEGALL